MRFPFRLAGDGAYAPSAAHLPPNMSLIPRLRKDAALYAPPPMRRRLSWKKTELVLYGERVVRLMHSYQAYWYQVYPDAPIQIVIVRGPQGKHEEEFFLPTDLYFTPKAVVEAYGHRWSQEVTHREAKRRMGIDGPKARLQPVLERQAPRALAGA